MTRLHEVLEGPPSVVNGVRETLDNGLAASRLIVWPGRGIAVELKMSLT